MNIIRKEANLSGAYPAPQSWRGTVPPTGYVLIPDSVDMTDFYAHNGFVVLTIEGDTVTNYEPNVKVWEEWRASQPEPTPSAPTAEERIAELEAINAELEDAICEMDATNEERFAAIEDALCEMDMG